MINRRIYSYLKDFFLNDKKALLALCNVMKNEEYAIKEAFIYTTKNIEILDRNIYLPVYLLMYLRERELPNKKIVFRPM